MAKLCDKDVSGIPKIIHFVHLGSSIRPRSIQDFASMNPSFRVMVWNERNIRSLGMAIDTIPHASYAGKSNLIRLHAVFRHGGIYLDTDMVPHKRLDPLLAHSAFAAHQKDGLICNAFFGATPNHPWIMAQIRFAHKFSKWDAGWGPKLMTVCTKPRLGVTMLDPNVCYPYSWDDESRKVHKDTIVEHLWAKSWLKQ